MDCDTPFQEEIEAMDTQNDPGFTEGMSTVFFFLLFSPCLFTLLLLDLFDTINLHLFCHSIAHYTNCNLCDKRMAHNNNKCGKTMKDS